MESADCYRIFCTDLGGNPPNGGNISWVVQAQIPCGPGYKINQKKRSIKRFHESQVTALHFGESKLDADYIKS